MWEVIEWLGWNDVMEKNIFLLQKHAPQKHVCWYRVYMFDDRDSCILLLVLYPRAMKGMLLKPGSEFKYGIVKGNHWHPNALSKDLGGVWLNSYWYGELWDIDGVDNLLMR